MNEDKRVLLCVTSPFESDDRVITGPEWEAWGFGNALVYVKATDDTASPVQELCPEKTIENRSYPIVIWVNGSRFKDELGALSQYIEGVRQYAVSNELQLFVSMHGRYFREAFCFRKPGFAGYGVYTLSRPRATGVTRLEACGLLSRHQDGRVVLEPETEFDKLYSFFLDRKP